MHTFDTTKTHRSRTVTPPRFLVVRLSDHLAGLDDDPATLLFIGRTGRPLYYNSWRRTHFDPAVAAAGLDDVTPHDLRATHATWVADRHGVMAAAKRLGHANGSVTTRHYARAVEQRAADIADDLDEQAEEGARERHEHGEGTEPPSPTGG